MQKKLHIKKGDTVVVIAGNNKGKKGRVLEIITKTERAIVEGVNMMKKHTKAQCGIPAGRYHRKRSICAHLKPHAVRRQSWRCNSCWQKIE